MEVAICGKTSCFVLIGQWSFTFRSSILAMLTYGPTVRAYNYQGPVASARRCYLVSPLPPSVPHPPISILLPSCLCFYSRANCCFFPLRLTISWLLVGGGDVPPLLFDVVMNPLYCPSTGKFLSLQPSWATLVFLLVHVCWPVSSCQLNASTFRCCPLGETCASRYVLMRQVPDKQIKWDLWWTTSNFGVWVEGHKWFHMISHDIENFCRITEVFVRVFFLFQVMSVDGIITCSSVCRNFWQLPTC